MLESPFALISLLVLMLMVVIACRGMIKSSIRRMIAAREAKTRDNCPCGYPLQGRDVARCPECGRVIHFDCTPEELGLTLEQLQLIQQKRKEREEQKPS